MNHILVVDADKSLRGLTVAALQKHGYSAAEASSAQTAIAACENQMPDLIILELQLRGHSGVEFIHEVRSYPEWQDIPIVLYTNVPQNSLAKFTDSFRAMGIAGYVYKTDATYQKLINIVEDTLLTVV